MWKYALPCATFTSLEFSILTYRIGCRLFICTLWYKRLLRNLLTQLALSLRCYHNRNLARRVLFLIWKSVRRTENPEWMVKENTKESNVVKELIVRNSNQVASSRAASHALLFAGAINKVIKVNSTRICDPWPAASHLMSVQLSHL